jgi:hypothetical protein
MELSMELSVENALDRRVRGVSVGRPVGLIALPGFDHVAVPVAEVAAGFLPAVDWGCEEVRAPRSLQVS